MDGDLTMKRFCPSLRDKTDDLIVNRNNAMLTKRRIHCILALTNSRS
jgi:hypothetical protein